MFLKATVLFASAHSGAARAILTGKPQQAGQPSGPTPVPKWADVARQSAEWWLHRVHMKAPDGQSPAALSQSVPLGVQPDDVLDLGVPPLGESPYRCGKVLPLGQGQDEMKRCSREEIQHYSHEDGMHDVSKIQPLMDLLVYTAYAPNSSMLPCKMYKQDFSGTNRFEVVIDSQFTNQPACCPMEYLLGGGATSVVEALSVYQPVSGSNISYTVLEPTAVRCNEKNPCPVVVELPGDGQVPWMLLQAWCDPCTKTLRSLIVSMTGVKSAAPHVEAQLMPALNGFLQSRHDIDYHRVYMVATGSGSEAGLLAVLRHPDIFAFGLFAGKFLITNDIKRAAASVKASNETKLQKISFHVGSSDISNNQDQNFWRQLTNVVKPIALDMQAELRYYPGGTNAMWYAAWNAYHSLLWTAKTGIYHYIDSVAVTCPPQHMFSGGMSEKYESKMKNKWFNEQSVRGSLAL